MVAVNSSGGVAGGDRLDIAVAAGPGARAVATAQAAERFYRAADDGAPAVVRASLRVAAGAALDWLPQETILFDGVGLDRALAVELAPDARFLGVETLLFGRAAMGEQVRSGRLRDRITVCRAGRTLLRDAIRLDGDMAAALDRSALGGGARAIATLVYVAPDAADRLDPLRAALAGLVEAGASCWDGMVVARLLARNGHALRAAVVAALSALRERRTLPRSWNL